jgi:GDPmannose 4,6-dehydratase
MRRCKAKVWAGCTVIHSHKLIGSVYRWEGTGVDEQGIDEESGKVLVKVDSRYFRPAEVE